MFNQQVSAPQEIGQFRAAKIEEYQDIMLSLFINNLFDTDNQKLKNKVSPLVRKDDAPRGE